MAGKTYILGGYSLAGNGLICYRLTRLLHTRFGHDCVIVAAQPNQTYENSAPLFQHPVRYESISVDELASVVTSEDLFISNPANSRHFFGGRLPCRKIMYVQSYTTFNILDGFFDSYVAVSQFVRRFLKFEYGITAPVIPPFTRAEHVPKNLIPWEERPPYKIMVMGKLFFAELLQLFCDKMAKSYPHIPIEINIVERFSKTQPELLQLMAEHRYFMQLSPCEGFGLTPLEAMACGCITLGFHGGGSLDYLRPMSYGVSDFFKLPNTGMVAYPQMDKLCDNVAYLLTHPYYANKLASRGNLLIHNYSAEKFDNHWIEFFNGCS